MGPRASERLAGPPGGPLGPAFADREDAGRWLARALGGYAGQDPLVLAIPRGAVPMAAVVAKALGGELDVVLVRKLGAPGNPEVAIGAVAEDGALSLDLGAAGIELDQAYVQAEAARQLDVLRARRAAYTPLRAPVDPRGRVVIVVDDGVATGSTMNAALRLVRARGPAELVAAAAVAPPATAERLRRIADRVVVLMTPANFVCVGQAFADFTQVTDEQVTEVLAAAGQGGARVLRA